MTFAQGKIKTILYEAAQCADEAAVIDFWSQEKHMQSLVGGLYVPVVETRDVYPLLCDYVVNVEAKYFVNSDAQRLRSVYRGLVKVFVSYKIKHRDLGIRSYLRYFDEDSLEYQRFSALALIRSSHTRQELLRQSDRIFDQSLLSSSLPSDTVSIAYEFFGIMFAGDEYNSFDQRLNLIDQLDSVVEYYNQYQGFADYIARHTGQYISNDSLEVDISWTSISEDQRDHLVGLQQKIASLQEENNKLRTQLHNLQQGVMVESDEYHIDRSLYQIGLIFGSSRSVKSYQRWLKKDGGKNLLIDLGIEDRQFDTLSTDFKKQSNLDVDAKLYGNTTFVIAFETDHNTKFEQQTRNNPDFAHRVTILDKPGQHFSDNEMENLLREAIEKYERVEFSL